MSKPSPLQALAVVTALLMAGSAAAAEVRSRQGGSGHGEREAGRAPGDSAGRAGCRRRAAPAGCGGQSEGASSTACSRLRPARHSVSVMRSPGWKRSSWASRSSKSTTCSPATAVMTSP